MWPIAYIANVLGCCKHLILESSVYINPQRPKSLCDSESCPSSDGRWDGPGTTGSGAATSLRGAICIVIVFVPFPFTLILFFLTKGLIFVLILTSALVLWLGVCIPFFEGEAVEYGYWFV